MNHPKNPILILALSTLAASGIWCSQEAGQQGPGIDSSAVATAVAQPTLDPTVLKDKAMHIMETRCVSCHGPDKQKGDVRLDALETIDPVDLQKLLATAKEVVHFEEMPPEKADQPSAAERKILIQWLDSQLTGDVAKALAEKLLRFEYGNVVNHKDLFSGEYADLPGHSRDRRWLISQYIFVEKVNRLLDYNPIRTIDGTSQRVQGDSGIHWSPKGERGNKFRRTITNPFLLPESVGVRYSGHEALTAGHLLTMIGNAKRIAKYMSSEAQMKAHYPAMLALMEIELKHRDILRSRQRFLTTYSYMDRLLQQIYGDQHTTLLPEIVRVEMPYPGANARGGKHQDRQTNLDFLGRLNTADVNAILNAIATYNPGNFKFDPTTPEGEKRWRPYGEADRAAFDEIILKSERDWYVYGVTDYRIKNRITTMKIFFDQWDMKALSRHIQNKGYGLPDYKPLADAEMTEIIATIKKNRQKGDRYQDVIDRCMADWEASLKAEREATTGANDQHLEKLVFELYGHVFERTPSTSELTENIALMRSYTGKLDMQQAIGKLIESLLLSTEFVYRKEFGAGDADTHGRRLLSSRDASYALAYALTDSSPDPQLAKAAEQGRLATRDDYEREVRRMLKKRDLWTIIDESVQAANINESITNQPIRKLRFFRDFFGYAKALKVFKDDHRFGAGTSASAISVAIDEADLLVAHILEQDSNVIEELLTTDKFFVYHSGDNAVMEAASQRLKAYYDHFKGYDWKNWGPAELYEHLAFMKKSEVHGGEKLQSAEANKTNDGAVKKFKSQMTNLEMRFGKGQEHAAPFHTFNRGFWREANVRGRTGQHMRGEQVTSLWNIDWRTWDYPAQQPAKIPNRKGILTHPAWLIAHAQNLETDPIHRGKWIREKLLAGTIPDVPITVDAVIPPDHAKTMRQRMENRTGDSYCWRCHQKMDPLGFPFENFDDFGRYRTDENLEHPDNLITDAKKAELTYGAKLAIYKTLPVDARGVLKGTDDPKLDGEVKDAFDLLDRLAKSDKVRQSVIRHAFRYFMGRNEMLSDSRTLIDAERAYLDHNGSFDEVIVSLLTSDSFMYRKATPAAQEQVSNQ